MGKFHADENAVSETIGYILIFMIVLTCIGIILLYGNGLLDNAKDQNNFRSMEQGLSLVQSDMKQVAMDSAPVKTTKIHMSSGTLFENNTTGSLSIAYDIYPTYNNNTGSLSYASGHSYNSLSIENGGLWEQYSDDMTGTVVTMPRIYGIDETNTLVINVIRINVGNLANGGSGTLNVMTKFNKTLVYDYTNPAGKDVTISYNTKYPLAWKNFFENQSVDQAVFPVTNVNPTSNSIGLTIKNVKELIIVDHVLDLKFSRAGV